MASKLQCLPMAASGVVKRAYGGCQAVESTALRSATAVASRRTRRTRNAVLGWCVSKSSNPTAVVQTGCITFSHSAAALPRCSLLYHR